MRTWLTEGRVSGDSLVWREEWRDWRNAGEVFPQLGAGKDEFGLDIGEARPNATFSRARPRSRRQQAIQQAGILTMLIVAVLVLLGLFVWVLHYYPAL